MLCGSFRILAVPPVLGSPLCQLHYFRVISNTTTKLIRRLSSERIDPLGTILLLGPTGSPK